MLLPKQMSKEEFFDLHTNGLSPKEKHQLLIDCMHGRIELPQWRENETKLDFNVGDSFNVCCITYDYNRKKIYKHYISNWNSSYDVLETVNME